VFDGQSMWISGAPMSGKRFLLSRIVALLQNKKGKRNVLVVSTSYAGAWRLGGIPATALQRLSANELKIDALIVDGYEACEMCISVLIDCLFLS
jgi:hypothetical protein